MNLPEFLFARLTEDEGTALFVERENSDSPFGEIEPWRLSWHDEYDLLCIAPSRALAECKAKWRTVEGCAAVAATQALSPIPRLLAEQVLRDMALPYADHPDFDPEWREGVIR